MKFMKKLLIVILALGMFTGCSALSRETSNKLALPENKTVPLIGKWVVEKCFDTDGNNKPNTGDNKWIGKVFDFSGDSITFDESYWEQVNYKIKRVDAEEYFLHKYSNAIKSFGISSKEVQVITASSDDRYLYEFVKLSDENIIVNIDNGFYCLGRAPDGYPGTDAKVRKTEKGLENEEVYYDDLLTRSGLLLGIRIPEQMGQKGSNVKLEQYVYKTYWISSTNRKIDSILSAGDIFLPRKNGFWKLAIQKILGGEGLEDTLSAVMVPTGFAEKPAAPENGSKKQLRMETKLRKVVLYVGNDYICTENIEENKLPGAPEAEEVKVLRTMPIDNITDMEGIKFSDLTGDNGSMAMEGAIAGILGSSNNNSLKNIVEEDQEENFALFRKTGHWFFKGRLNLEPGESMAYVDFNINLIPPADMVAYDILHVPWTLIKDRVPQAIDAYTSPNSDMAIVLTRNAIVIYSIEAGDVLSEEPVKKLAIPEGSMVVMAEWATGDYVKNWEKSFMKNNQTEQVLK